MAPQVLTTPRDPAHRERWRTVDERILPQPAQHSPSDQEHKVREERNCFYCLEGWVFLGSIGHDGEEVYEAIRCRRCKGTARINR
jgi:predicted SprT family Zn-dependent metalloprotease